MQILEFGKMSLSVEIIKNYHNTKGQTGAGDGQKGRTGAGSVVKMTGPPPWFTGAFRVILGLWPSALPPA